MDIATVIDFSVSAICLCLQVCFEVLVIVSSLVLLCGFVFDLVVLGGLFSWVFVILLCCWWCVDFRVLFRFVCVAVLLLGLSLLVGDWCLCWL